MPIRILHVVEALGVGGGVENGIANLLAGMDRNRFEHTLCAVFHTGPQLERYPRDVRIRCLGQKHGRFQTQIGALAKVIRELRPDVVHSRNWGALEAVPAGRWAGGCFVIHSEHGVEVDPAAEPKRRRWIRRAAYTMAHRVFSVSERLRNILCESTGYTVRNFDVIHNGVNLGRFRPDAVLRRSSREALGIQDGEFCVGAVGRLNRIKDYPTLLRAMELLIQNRPKSRLFVVGDGSEHGALTGIVQSSSALRTRVRFLGARSDIPEFLNAIDGYVLPSICEGISNSLLEAMSTGLPVIASDTGGNPEVVVGGISGLLFPVGGFEALARHLERVSNDADLRNQLANAALARVRDEFSLHGMIRRYEQLYAAAAESVGRRECGAEALCRGAQ